MNKGILIAGVVVIIIIAGGWYWYSQSGGGMADDGGNESMQEDESSSMSANTIAALMRAGAPVQCDFANEDENGTQEGMVYLAGEKMRGNFMMLQVNGDAMSGSVIRDGEYAYTWGDGPTGVFGTKIKLSELDDADADSQERTFDVNQEVDLNCRSWSVNNALFAPPSDVDFQDLTATMQQMDAMRDEMSGAADEMREMSGVDCSVCDQISAGAGRDQCLQSLGC